MTSRCLRAFVATLLFGTLLGMSTAASARQANTPHIHFLNPSPAYYTGSDATGSSQTPAISDRSDGADELYRLVAWASDVSPGTRVVAAIRIGDTESVIGQMARSTDLPDTWQFLWDVPEELPTGSATLIAKLVHPNGPTIARDEVSVRLTHKPSGSAVTTNPGPDQGVGLTWPKLGGSLGFYRKPGGAWMTVLDGVTSEGTQQLRAFYSVTPPGAAPEFVFCGLSDTQPQIEPYAFQMVCELQAEATPKQVTAVGLVAEGTYEDGGQTQGLGLTQESADVVRTEGQAQSVKDMTLSVAPYGRAQINQCAGLVVKVLDDLGRPVQGANIDVHLKGPEGSGFATGASTSSSKAPDAGKHEVAPTTNCSGSAAGEQGVHPAPEGERPTFHRESTDGSGLSGPDGVAPGVWRFDAYSTAPGFADVTVWLDEASGGKTDNDRMGTDEVAVHSRLQWLPVAPSISIDSLAKSAATSDGCIPFLARVKAGDVPVPGTNVNLEAAGPADGVAFCSVPGGDEVWKPDVPQEGTGGAPASDPPVRTLEGDTDARGNLLFGLRSAVGGDTSIAAWLDGESASDDDVRATSEPRSTRSFAWAAGPADVRLGFLNPSPFGSSSPGSGQGTQLLPGGDVDVAVRASVAKYVEQLRLSVSSDGGLNFFEIGSLTRVGETDVFRTRWTADLPRGDHTLRVELPDTSQFADLAIQIGVPGAVDTSTAPYETARITAPANGERVPFNKGITGVVGRASAGAEGVDLFYTTAPGGITPGFTDWVYCGYVDLNGTGGGEQTFAGDCELADGERPWAVSGIAALSVDCLALPGCDASATGGGPAGRIAAKDSGDAVRVYGREAAPTLSIELPRTKGRVNTCHPVNVLVTDAAGGIVPESTVDVQLAGQGVRVCGVTGGSRAYYGPGHVKVPTFLDGVGTVDIIAGSAGRTNVRAWLDKDGDGERDEGEAEASATFTWKPGS